jgi:hypothetical protein
MVAQALTHVTFFALSGAKMYSVWPALLTSTAPKGLIVFAEIVTPPLDDEFDVVLDEELDVLPADVEVLA